MTTTDMPTDTFPPPPAPHRTLRRSRPDRVPAGVSGGLGEYFGVDPVIFRVVFATSAFFGGAGILAYLLAWSAIPEVGTQHAPIDGAIARLRRRRTSPWLLVAAAVVVWIAAFSWWVPGPFVLVVAIVVVLAVVFSRRDLQGSSDDRPVDLTKPTDSAPDSPTWAGDARGWWGEARAAARLRRRRALPVRIGTLVALVVSLGTLAIVDAVSGIALPVYFWTVLGLVLAGLLVGLVLRRTPWSLIGLLPLTVGGLLAFGGSHASLHDGIGNRTWTPTATPASQYRLAFGQGVLDLRSLPSQPADRTVRVTVAAGTVRLLLPDSGNVAVDANVHIGQIDVRGAGRSDGPTGGTAVATSVPAPAGAAGGRITVNVHLADGHVDIVRG